MLGRLTGGIELSAKRLREELDEFIGRVSWYEHKPYGTVLHVAPRAPRTALHAGGTRPMRSGRQLEMVRPCGSGWPPMALPVGQGSRLCSAPNSTPFTQNKWHRSRILAMVVGELDSAGVHPILLSGFGIPV